MLLLFASHMVWQAVIGVTAWNLVTWRKLLLITIGCLIFIFVWPIIVAVLESGIHAATIIILVIVKPCPVYINPLSHNSLFLFSRILQVLPWKATVIFRY
jgi:hypothetical protein